MLMVKSAERFARRREIRTGGMEIADEKNFDKLDPVVKRAKSRKQVFAWSGEQRMLPISASAPGSLFRSRPLTA